MGMLLAASSQSELRETFVGNGRSPSSCDMSPHGAPGHARGSNQLGLNAGLTSCDGLE